MIEPFLYQQKVVNGLSNGAIFNDLERPKNQISRSRHYLLLNICTDIVTVSY